MFSRVTLLCLAATGLAAAYTTHRNVKDYGAIGDGVADDSAAIIRAITEGRADNPDQPYGSAVYSSSTTTPGYVYFPPGTYKITQTLPFVYYTQLVGDVDDIPTIKMVSSVAIRMIDALDSRWGGNLVNQNNFYHNMHHFVLDMTECNECTGIHWQVAQATQISFVTFKMNVGSKSQGIWMENGSGGFISDLVFEGGMYAMWVGNQQFTSRNITIRDASIAGIYLNWDWGWTFKSLRIENCPVGIDVGFETGSLIVLDSTFSNVTTAAIRTQYDATKYPQMNSLVVDNVLLDASVAGSSSAIVMNGETVVLGGDSAGSALKRMTSTSYYATSWVQGHLLENGGSTVGTYDLYKSGRYVERPAALVTSGAASSSEMVSPFFEMPRPVFESKTYSRIDAVKDFQVPNDGTTDATSKLQAAVNSAAESGKVLFLPYGIYLITNTLEIPSGSRIIGEAWSVIMVGQGNNSKSVFADPYNPVAGVRVGKVGGEAGLAQMVNMLITTQGPQPGAVLMEWNMRDPEGAQGSAGLWEVHFRVGGAIGTNIDPKNCPRGTGANAPADKCTGAWALMRMTETSSAYLENVWGWVADHDLDYDDQINVYNARGFLCEAKAGPVWMYGTAFEHSILYQYNFVNGASNVLLAMIQTETPYFQPSLQTPFLEMAIHPTDPSFCTGDSRCNMSFGLVIGEESHDFFIYGTGLYSFFYQWSQLCLESGNGPDCQLEMIKIHDNARTFMPFNVNTYGTVYMQTQAESYSKANQHTNTFCSTAAADLNHAA